MGGTEINSGALAGAIGMTGAEIDDLFRAAGQITA
jgi:hypothetical protein